MLSMWRDINVFNGAGVPAITCGPGARTVGRGEGMPFLLAEDLVKASQAYALLALFVRGRPFSP